MFELFTKEKSASFVARQISARLRKWRVGWARELVGANLEQNYPSRNT